MKLLNWFTFPRLIIFYALSLPVTVAGAALLFFFPIFQIYDAAGWEFSNLGPIATAAWGFIIWLFVVTPLFILAVITKLIRRKSGHAG